jgi:hypothetical protein
MPRLLRSEYGIPGLTVISLEDRRFLIKGHDPIGFSVPLKGTERWKRRFAHGHP